MSRRRIIVYAVGFLCLGSVLAAGLEDQAREIEGMLMAPCCGATTLATHDSPAAYRMRVEIRQMLTAGRSRQEILDLYVERYGEAILAAPPARGFNLVAYLAPGAGLLVLGVILLFWIRRVARRAPAAGPVDDRREPDPLHVQRLEREIREFR